MVLELREMFESHSPIQQFDEDVLSAAAPGIILGMCLLLDGRCLALNSRTVYNYHRKAPYISRFDLFLAKHQLLIHEHSSISGTRTIEVTPSP